VPRKYVATRGVSWRKGEGELNREAGDDVSDAPATAIKDWLSIGAVKEVSDV
jgi:hypothetical protein